MTKTTTMQTERDTKLTSEPVCPHCGHRHTDSWEWDFGPWLEGARTGECDSCGEAFMTERQVTIYYTTAI